MQDYKLRALRASHTLGGRFAPMFFFFLQICLQKLTFVAQQDSTRRDKRRIARE